MGFLVNIPPGPTWGIVNMDNYLSVPLPGQFDPKLVVGKTRPIWQRRPGLAGAKPWVKYVGNDVGQVSFEFYVVGLTVTDIYPEFAWMRLQELASSDEALGRPPRIMFMHGLRAYQGYITDVPEMPIEYWSGGLLNSRIVRAIGPGRVTITLAPDAEPLLSLGTSYIPKTEGTLFEDLAKTQYGDARYGQGLTEYNQGVGLNETIEMPRKSLGLVTRDVFVAAYFEDSIEGL
jgi:hypothetical protein